jgi:hypothetical protein
MRLRHQRRSTTLHDSKVQVIVDNEFHWVAAVSTGRIDLYHEGAVPQLPLHEGRRYRVFRSGRVQSFSRAENQMVSGIFNRDRKSPGHFFCTSANEEEQVPRQIFHNGRRSCSGNAERLRNGSQRNRPAQPWEFSDDEVPYQVVIIRHERQALTDLLRRRTHLLLPVGLWNAADGVAPP